MNTTHDDQDFTEWIDNFFDLDPLVLNLVYQIYIAHRDKHLTGIGLIIEREAPKPIKESEIAKLSLHLTN